jgi:2,3-bisphosphoglycerate-independent phosphoglycerate mutase
LKTTNINNKPHVVLLFLDGVGIGKKDPDINPFSRACMPALTALCGGDLPHIPFKRVSSNNAEVTAIDATLGVEGLPQSGTGQTAIFTGVNGAKKFGRHFGPYPPSILRSIIEKKNIFIRCKKMGKSVVFANAFPQRFFDYINSGTRRFTVLTLSCKYTDVPLLTVKELQNGEGISSDIIRAGWKDIGYPNLKPVTASEAGRHLVDISARYDLTVFEYWLTDHAGHAQKMQEAVEVLERFDVFLSGFMESFDPYNTLLMVFSDHGNIEDLSVKSHTRNRVPCIIAGNGRRKLADRIKNLTHITPAVISLFLDQ